MTAEELLKSRIKCHTSFLGMEREGYSVNDVFVPVDAGEAMLPQRYPANFRWLNWWEERKVEELPAHVTYVDDTSSHYGVHKVVSWSRINSGYVTLEVGDSALREGKFDRYTPTTEVELLEDVIKNLTNGKWSKKEITNSLSFGERNTELYYPLMKKYQPQYYSEGWDCPVQSFTLVKDLGLNDIS